LIKNGILKADSLIKVVKNGDLEFPAVLKPGAQDKHIIRDGNLNFKLGASVFDGDHKKAQDLLDRFAGTGTFKSSNKELIDFGEVIGTYVEEGTGRTFQTSLGNIHYSKNGAHIVPARPNP
jgi:hypothetical protein